MRKVLLLNVVPKPEEISHVGDKRRALSAEYHRKLAYGFFSAFIKFHHIFYCRAVFIFKAAFKRHGQIVGRKERNKLAVWRNRLFNSLKNIVYPALGSCHSQILRKNLVYQVGTVCSALVRQKIYFAYNIIA